MSSEPERLILQLLREMRAEIGDVRGDVASVRDVIATKSDVTSLRADLAADLLATRKDLGDQIVGLRRAIVEYHTSVIAMGF